MKRLGIILIFLFFVPTCLATIPYYPNSKPACSKRKTNSLFMRYIMHNPCTNPRVRRARARCRTPIRKVNLNNILPCNVNEVYVRGGINLVINGNQKVNRASLNCAYEDLTIKVCNNAVYISNNRPGYRNQCFRPEVRLSLCRLNRLVVTGDSCITGRNVNSCCGLDIENCGCGQITLEGPVNLVRVTNIGSASICAPCVTSDHLHILATRHALVRLYGRANLLLIRAFQDSYVDTRFLRSETAMVQAMDKALVTVKTTGSLQAFASGCSNVYYYTSPCDFYKHTMISGNVFQMGDGW